MQENIKKIFSYKNTEEKQQELAVDLVESSKNHKIKMWTLRLLVIAVFAFLCFEKVYNDFTYGTALRESTSLIILMYIVCGVLWTIVLPMIFWKVKIIVILKEIKNRKLKYEGDVTFEITEEDICIKSNNQEIEVKWDKMIKLSKSNKIIILTAKQYGEIIMPIDMFETLEEAEKIYDMMDKKINAEVKEVEKEEE
ncbi:MAG: hypothetical protein MR274_00100 [Clostridium sp.]|nr:hypothetical protein [Clostridium sp.]MDY3828464.1 hypothetical protein [Clostridium sp.]